MHTDLDLVRAIHADRLRAGQAWAEAPRGRPGRWRTIMERAGTVLRRQRAGETASAPVSATSRPLAPGTELPSRPTPTS